MKRFIVIIGIAAVCFSLATVAVHLHRAYNIAVKLIIIRNKYYRLN